MSVSHTDVCAKAPNFLALLGKFSALRRRRAADAFDAPNPHPGLADSSEKAETERDKKSSMKDELRKNALSDQVRVLWRKTKGQQC